MFLINFLSKSVFGILFGACLCCFQGEAAESKQAKPNIIFFLVLPQN
jgi:hypothetical protein